MKYLITENQYEFLKWGTKPRKDYLEEFGQKLQDLIDENMESILSETNGFDNTDDVADIVVHDVKLGIGNRAYDVEIWAGVYEKESGPYGIQNEILKHIILDIIRKEFGFKCGVDVKMAKMG
jgi:hypothetical protein